MISIHGRSRKVPLLCFPRQARTLTAGDILMCYTVKPSLSFHSQVSRKIKLDLLLFSFRSPMFFLIPDMYGFLPNENGAAQEDEANFYLSVWKGRTFKFLYFWVGIASFLSHLEVFFVNILSESVIVSCHGYWSKPRPESPFHLNPKLYFNSLIKCPMSNFLWRDSVG